MAHDVQLVIHAFISTVYTNKSVFHCLAQTTQNLKVLQKLSLAFLFFFLYIFFMFVIYIKYIIYS